MRILLDTHILLWALDGTLEQESREVIDRGAEAVVVSAASVWEIEIKRGLDKLRAPDDIAGLVDSSRFDRLAIEFAHAREAGRLPRFHGDPFDRMLVAQAKLEGLTLATADAALAEYGVPVLAVSPG